jgi:hypothetical protein
MPSPESTRIRSTISRSAGPTAPKAGQQAIDRFGQYLREQALSQAQKGADG